MSSETQDELMDSLMKDYEDQVTREFEELAEELSQRILDQINQNMEEKAIFRTWEIIRAQVFDMGDVNNGDQGVIALANTGKNQVNFDKITGGAGSTTIFMGGLIWNYPCFED